MFLTSLQHSLVKRMVKLRQDRAFRLAEQSVVVTCRKIIEEIAPHVSFKRLFFSERTSPVTAAETFLTTPEILSKIAGVPQGIEMAVEMELPPSRDLSTTSPLLICDGIADPGNLGTLLRTAWAFGWKGAVMTPTTVDPFNDKAIRAAKGASFLLPLAYAQEEWQTWLQEGKFHIYVADPRGESIEHFSFLSPLALVLGNEAHGVSPFFRERGKKVSIPQRAMESLNVAVAGGILMEKIGREELRLL